MKTEYKDHIIESEKQSLTDDCGRSFFTVLISEQDGNFAGKENGFFYNEQSAIATAKEQIDDY